MDALTNILSEDLYQYIARNVERGLGRLIIGGCPPSPQQRIPLEGPVESFPRSGDGHRVTADEVTLASPRAIPSNPPPSLSSRIGPPLGEHWDDFLASLGAYAMDRGDFNLIRFFEREVAGRNSRLENARRVEAASDAGSDDKFYPEGGGILHRRGTRL